MTTNDPTTARLHRAVLLHREDDAARMVLADRLEEIGQSEYGEFIRVQTKLADTRKGVAEAKAAKVERWAVNILRYQEGELRQRQVELWGYLPRKDGVRNLFNDDLPGWAVLLDGDDGRGLTRHYPWAIVRRGFVAEIALTLAAFEQHAAAIFRAHPVEVVRPTDREPDFVEREPGFDPWTWHNDEARPTRHTLPRDIWRLIPRGWFRHEGEALDAASTALVTWGRRQAGLEVPCRACQGRRELWYVDRPQPSFRAADQDEPIKPTVPRRGPCRVCKGTGWVPEDHGG